MNIELTLAKIPAMTADLRKTLRANAKEKLASDDPKWASDAPRVLAALDAQEASELVALVKDVAGTAPAERVIRAFTTVPMTETEEKLIRVLLDHPDSTSAELTEKMGWKAQSWHLHFGTMCANRGVYPPSRSVELIGKLS